MMPEIAQEAQNGKDFSLFHDNANREQPPCDKNNN